MNKPIINSYCVIPGKVYAGKYAGDLHNPELKVRQLESFGITHFIDLTEDGELNPYTHLLGSNVHHRRFPIKDAYIPDSYNAVYELVKYIHSVTEHGNSKVYIHCWGGVGRTGTIVACLYEYLGEDFESAVRYLRDSFRECPKSQWRKTPETEEQLEFVKGFGEYLKKTGSKKSAAEYTPENINELKPNEVFVFGSSLAGYHRGGAARVAREKFGAISGQGVGLQGRSYAIPTLQGGVDTIKPFVDEFIDFAKSHPELKFYVTRIGCGIAGFKDEEIAPLFRDVLGMENVVLPKSFADVIEPKFPYDAAALEDALNWTLPGLQFFYRDTNVDQDLDRLAQLYKDKNIIRAGFFIDCTSRAARPVKNVRFIIASAHAAAIWEVMGDRDAEQWRLNVFDYNSYFKVLDTYRVGDQLQILLLHIPLRGIAVFAGMDKIHFGDGKDLAALARMSFDNKLMLDPLPWLESEAWDSRTCLLPGTSSDGWAELIPVAPANPQVADLHSAILGLAQDDTDLNKP